MLNMDVCVGKLSKYLIFSSNPIMTACLFIDTDECVDTSMHNCSEIDHEICRNLEGSYVCDCSSGFERQGNVCQGTYLLSLNSTN